MPATSSVRRAGSRWQYSVPRIRADRRRCRVGVEFPELRQFRTSTHNLGLAEMIGLARALVRMPALKIAKAAGVERLRSCLYGVVQGVGFRPFVYRLASQKG